MSQQDGNNDDDTNNDGETSCIHFGPAGSSPICDDEDDGEQQLLFGQSYLCHSLHFLGSRSVPSGQIVCSCRRASWTLAGSLATTRRLPKDLRDALQVNTQDALVLGFVYELAKQRGPPRPEQTVKRANNNCANLFIVLALDLLLLRRRNQPPLLQSICIASPL